MAILGTTTSETLLWDFSETQLFYLLRKPPLVSITTLYIVSPQFASTWFSTGSTVYDPFYYSVPGTTSPSTII